MGLSKELGLLATGTPFMNVYRREEEDGKERVRILEKGTRKTGLQDEVGNF